MPSKAIIIGAGPAGLTAAWELLKRTNIRPIILEKDDIVGGISRTVQYKGNRMDFGPHRFFSKSDRVMNWWLHMMPLSQAATDNLTIHYRNQSQTVPQHTYQGNGHAASAHMLVIQRLTRIYFLRRFFTYPIQLSIDTLRKLGLWRTLRIMASYAKARIAPRRPEKTLEDFLINRFGNTLYLLFFKDYTEKVWGVPCTEISAEWGAQRIKGVSISKAIAHALQSIRPKGSKNINQQGTETSLIEQFLYPALGAGQLWEEVARQIEEMGGIIIRNYEVTHIHQDSNRITCIEARHRTTGKVEELEGDYFFSTMPVQQLIAGMQDCVPLTVQEVAAGLQYRDFINVGVLLKKLQHHLKDNWIYIQDNGVKVGRIQVYNNWGGHMVADPSTTWIGLEYFCNTTDQFWQQSDEVIKKVAIEELEKIGLASCADVLDITVNRMEKTYPAYFGSYERFEEIKAFTDLFENLFLIGRNGMHKYNNADHSMLTAMVAVDNIINNVVSKENLWDINTEQEYHEEKKEQPKPVADIPTQSMPMPAA